MTQTLKQTRNMKKKYLINACLVGGFLMPLSLITMAAEDPYKKIPPAQNGLPKQEAEMTAELDRKLNSIIIGKFEIYEGSLESAVAILIDQSRRDDPSHEGINISIDRSLTEMNNGKVSGGGRKISMQLEHMPLNRVIEYLTEALGLKYRADKDGVVIFMASSH